MDPRFTGAPRYAYAAPQTIPRPPRVALHVRTLAILWLCFGVWRVLGGLLGMVAVSLFSTHRFAGWVLPLPFDRHTFPPVWVGWMTGILVVTTIVAAGLAFATGYALLHRKSWGRVLALIAGILALFKFPLGTALGIYTLWVLLPSPSDAEYHHLSAISET